MPRLTRNQVIAQAISLIKDGTSLPTRNGRFLDVNPDGTLKLPADREQYVVFPLPANKYKDWGVVKDKPVRLQLNAYSNRGDRPEEMLGAAEAILEENGFEAQLYYPLRSGGGIAASAQDYEKKQ